MTFTEQFDVVGTLEEIRATGKTRFIGVSAVLPHITAFIERVGDRRVEAPALGLGRVLV